jgi:hypothetical protein
MPGTGTLPQVDVSTIPDPDIRRAFRAVVQINEHLTTQVRQQQQEIEALLQMMVEKHVGSVGEFKRHMLRLQTADARSERIHGQIAGGASGVGAPAAATAPAAGAHRPRIDDDDDRPRRYTL